MFNLMPTAWKLVPLVFLCAVSGTRTPDNACSQISIPKITGFELVSITGMIKRNATFPPFLTLNPKKISIDYCDVVVIITHPGANDSVRIDTWLPLSGWSGRFQGQGGGGFAMQSVNSDNNIPIGLAYAVSQGYAAASTDGGFATNPYEARAWANQRPLLINFSQRSLHDMTLVGKAVTRSFYGKPAKYSYYNGCSQGGRQGLALAQRYPTDYDGISANAPALNLPSIAATGAWPQVVMQQTGMFPSQCEFQAFRDASIQACDGLDGVADGLVSKPSQCFYNARELIGTIAKCGNTNITITGAAADIMNRIWDGPRSPSNNHPLWYGWSKDTNLALFTNSSTREDGSVTGEIMPLWLNWFKEVLVKDDDFVASSITPDGLEAFFYQGNLEWNTYFATDNPDLTEFKDSGGKMITWHGLADDFIPFNGTVQYLVRVIEAMGDRTEVDDFYRVFLAPGGGHCGFGYGPTPIDPLAAVVAWVEHGMAPDFLAASVVNATTGAVRNTHLCPWPTFSQYDGFGDIEDTSSYMCVEV